MHFSKANVVLYPFKIGCFFFSLHKRITLIHCIMLPMFYLIKRNAELHFRTNIFEYLRKKYLNQLYTCTFILSTQILYFYNNVHRRWKNLCVQKYFWKINSDLYLFQNACQAPLVQIAPLYVLFQHMVKNAKTYATVTTKPAML